MVTLRQGLQRHHGEEPEVTQSCLWFGNRWRAQNAQSSASSRPRQGVSSRGAPVQSWLRQDGLDGGIHPLALLSLWSPGVSFRVSQMHGHLPHSVSCSWLRAYDSRHLRQGVSLKTNQRQGNTKASCFGKATGSPFTECRRKRNPQFLF